MRMIVLAVVVAACAGVAGPTAAGAQAPMVSELEQEFVALINELRVSQGLSALDVHPELAAKARRWSATMSHEGRIWHSDLADGIGAPWERLGENVGLGGSVRGLHDAFVASPGHYANLVDRHFEFVGIGVVVDAAGTIFVTEEFMELRTAGTEGGEFVVTSTGDGHGDVARAVLSLDPDRSLALVAIGLLALVSLGFQAVARRRLVGEWGHGR